MCNVSVVACNVSFACHLSILSAACFLSVVVFAAEAVCKTGSLTEFEQAAVDKHNELRQRHQDTDGLCYGESGDDISFSAQIWADEITRGFHNPQSYSNDSQHYDSSNPYGENLGSSRSRDTYEEEGAAYRYFTQTWYDEIKYWDYSTNTTNGFGGTRHFTQVVWKDSKQLNCGYGIYYDSPDHVGVAVCQYYPAGNMVGEYGANVQPRHNSAGFATVNTAALVAAAIFSVDCLNFI